MKMFLLCLIKMLSDFDLSTDCSYTTNYYMYMLRIYLWLVERNSFAYYHQFLFVGLCGYPAAWVEIRVVVDSLEG